MYPVQPDSTVTVNCKENPLDCLPCPGGGVCYELAEPPPPPPIPVLPRAPPDRHAPVRLLLTVSLLSAFLFLSLALATLLLYRRRRRILRRRRRVGVAAAAGALPAPDEDWFVGDGDEEEGGGGVVHHVWYIRTVGLDDATIASIRTVEYRGGAVGRGGDCAVCLGEFGDGELVRLLPRCAHPFHASCIDTWLRAHVNCPLCRSPVVVVPSDPPAVALDPEANVVQYEERQVLDEIPLSEVESHAEGSEDSDAPSEAQSEDTFVAAADDSERATPNPIRRSASMDSPMFLVPVPETQDDDTQCNRKLPSAQGMRVFRVKGKTASGVSSSSCQAGRLKIGRSMSSSGLGFFFSRNGRSSGTVLPL